MMNFDDDAIQLLATAVLKKAIEDNDLEETELEFWCDVVGLNQPLFFKKARKAATLRRP